MSTIPLKAVFTPDDPTHKAFSLDVSMLKLEHGDVLAAYARR